MLFNAILASVAAGVFARTSRPLKSLPVFPKSYIAEGFILMPYCELQEPFVIYYDQKSRRTRTDYYGGEMKTIQNPYGNFQLVWSPNEKTHIPEENCYMSPSTSLQSVFPNLTSFEYVRTEKCDTDSATLVGTYIKQGVPCHRFEDETEDLNRTSKFVFWSYVNEDGSHVPVRYAMMGYDSLFGTHYDKYEIVYTKVRPGRFDPRVFDIRSLIDKECIDFPSPIEDPWTLSLNPMKEFVGRDDAHLAPRFAKFRKAHGKSFSSPEEERESLNNFRHNQRYVDSMNRRNLSYALKLNHRADWGNRDFKVLRGRLQFTPHRSQARLFSRKLYVNRALPASIDWRLQGAVTPVRDQAICGSCWSFASVGHLEGLYFRKYGKLLRFSEQQLVDCAWNEGNDACDGGIDYLAFDYVRKYGLATTDQYGLYRGIDGKCKDLRIKDKPIRTIRGYVNVTSAEDLRRALAHVGPISVSIDASMRSFSFYSHGVYEDPECSSTNLNHAVLAVGYGTLRGKPYWLIKNSWSTYWGNDGYILVAQKDNICGVTTAAVYAEL